MDANSTEKPGEASSATLCCVGLSTIRGLRLLPRGVECELPPPAALASRDASAAALGCGCFGGLPSSSPATRNPLPSSESRRR